MKSVDSGAFLPLQLSARADTPQGDFELHLRVQPGAPRVLQGRQGYSAKSAESGNASYYYSYTRLPSRGVVRTPAGQFQVVGQSWFDREWGSSMLSSTQAGWDWFALQLDDGRDLMFYRLRQRNGETDPNSAGILLSVDRTRERIVAREVHLTPLRDWRSADGRRYPVAWSFRYRDLRLKIEARVDAQAYSTGIPYWEGAVGVSGEDSKGAVSGLGYLEMSGY